MVIKNNLVFGHCMHEHLPIIQPAYHTYKNQTRKEVKRNLLVPFRKHLNYRPFSPLEKKKKLSQGAL